MEQPIVVALANAGGVAILAGIIFMMYRKDKDSSEKRIIEICTGHENRLLEDRQQLTRMVERDQVSREANTKALTELTTVLERMNGKH
jgi:hypothetical protein